MSNSIGIARPTHRLVNMFVTTNTIWAHDENQVFVSLQHFLDNMQGNIANDITMLQPAPCQLQPFEAVKVLQDGLLLSDAARALAKSRRIVLMACRPPWCTMHLTQVSQAVQALARPLVEAPRVHAGLGGGAGSLCHCRTRAESRQEAGKLSA